MRRQGRRFGIHLGRWRDGRSGRIRPRGVGRSSSNAARRGTRTACWSRPTNQRGP